jgi:uncharacterized CHY-type Zn-finger protein
MLFDNKVGSIHKSAMCGVCQKFFSFNEKKCFGLPENIDYPFNNLIPSFYRKSLIGFWKDDL